MASSAKKLLIVESPAKAKTIGKYLGGDFTVLASVGHVRDLPRKGLNIRITADGSADDRWTFSPTYEISADKKKVVAELAKAARSASEIYLAPDPDREGEAIAWHLKEVLSDAAGGKPFHRVSYNEITKSAVLDAVAHPREIDGNRVDAQQARRVLDRLVGFKVSPLLWKNLPYGFSLSAGRVQSVALRLLVEREAEIRGFKTEKYWVLGVEARKGATAFTARLARVDGEKADVRGKTTAMALVDDLDGAVLVVSSLKKTPSRRHAYPPFTTSTLQQAASSALGFSPHRTMSLAQKLYEEGLITYMRTDSVNIADVARAAAAAFIEAEYGKAFLPEKPNFYKGRAGAQQAHEAIRPTDVTKTPGSLSLDSASAKLYDLVWRRFVASQMADAQLVRTSVALEPRKDTLRHEYEFTASVTEVAEEGFLRVMKTALAKKKEEGDEDSDEVNALPKLAPGERVDVLRWLSDEKETKPPARYSEAALVKALEENGVGRPSTYAQTIETLVGRKYAERAARQLVPTKRGEDVSNWLVGKLEPLFNVGYTAQMEAALDKVEDGEENGNGMLSAFYKRFAALLETTRTPPPDPALFRSVFALLKNVKTWKEPVKRGKFTYDDRAFVQSLEVQFVGGGKSLSDRQLQSLVRLAAVYRDQIPDCESALARLGFGGEFERVLNAPDAALVQWCFVTLDRIGGLEKNVFIKSLREQVDRGRTLSAKQFAILARTTGENAGALDDAEAVRARLAPYVPGGFGAAPADPVIPELLAMLDAVKTWKEPAKRGRRTYDDAEFAASLKEQYARRRSLSDRQTSALRRMIVAYRDQIPGVAESAARLGLDLERARTASAAKRGGRAPRRAK